MGKSCNHPTCDEVCRRPKQKKVREPVRKVSKKRAEENRKYSVLRKQFLEDKMCEAGLEGCTGVAEQVHHMSGRIGNNFLDTSTWLGVCQNCHNWIESHPERSRELKLSKSRLINE